MDAQTFLIPNFTYNGQVTLKMELFEDTNICFELQAPDAHFWVGEGSRPGPEVNIYIIPLSIQLFYPSTLSVWFSYLSGLFPI